MARFLVSRGFAVKVTDIDGSKAKDAHELEALGVDCEFGVHNQSTFDRAQAIIPSPGIPTTIAPILQARQKGVAIQGELDIFSRYNTTPVLAITGTNGKTTTTTLCRDMLEASGLTTFMGGNIGIPLMDYLISDPKADVVVAEISSFQLDLAADFHPRVALLLNITQDHLNRYSGFEGYVDSKWRIFAHQGPQDLAVVNTLTPGIDTVAETLKSRVLTFGSAPASHCHARITPKGISFLSTKETGAWEMDISDMDALPGAHNRENIAAAALGTLELGATVDGIRRAVKDFKGLPHRIALVRELDGVRYYNDSKGTNVDAVDRALECFDTPVVLIMGGQAKGVAFTDLIPNVKARVKAVIAIGESMEQVVETFSNSVSVTRADTMARAVSMARDLADAGEVVLLSPACASFDMYPNYQARGEDFTTLVEALDRE